MIPGDRVIEDNKKGLPENRQIKIHVIGEGPEIRRLDVAGAIDCDMTEYRKAILTLQQIKKKHPQIGSFVNHLVLQLTNIERWRNANLGAPYAVHAN